MARLRVAIEIDASPGDVWSTVESIEHHVEWMADAEAIRFETGQTRGVGTRFVCDTKIGPISLADRMEVTEWIPQHRIGVRHAGIVKGVGAFELSPLDLGRRTRFSWDEQLRFPWYLAGRLGEWIGGALVMRPIWRRNLGRLKAQIESASH